MTSEIANEVMLFRVNIFNLYLKTCKPSLATSCNTHEIIWLIISQADNHERETSGYYMYPKDTTPLGSNLANNCPLILSEPLDLSIGNIRDGHLLQPQKDEHNRLWRLCRGDNQFSSRTKHNEAKRGRFGKNLSNSQYKFCL